MASTPIAFDGFGAQDYLAGQPLSGEAPSVDGFDGPWSGAPGAAVVAGSLEFAGLGAAGAHRVELSASTTTARLLDTDYAGPLANYIGGDGLISSSASGASLYVSALMRVDGSSPPAATLSFYNGGVSSSDRVFRVLASSSNTHFQAIAGASGVPVDLDPLNAGVNLFVIRVDFAAGADTIRVWQNPVAGLPEPAADATITGYDLALDRIGFTRFGGVGSAQFDELRLGDSWSAVTSQEALSLLPRAPISVEGFGSQDYPGGLLPGVWSFITAYDGAWESTGPASVSAGALEYPGLGEGGSNRLLLDGSTVTSRKLLTTNNGPLANYIGGDGLISSSASGASLYVSALMRVDGSSPPAATLSFYNGGVSSSDRVFRVLASSSNTHFQAIAGASGVPVDLDPLNAGVNLFVIRVDFAAGADTIRVWQNPVAGLPEPAADATITGYDLALDRIGFTRFGGVGSAQFDELRLGDSWSAVTSQEALSLLPGPRDILALQEPPPSPLPGGDFPDGFFPFIDEFGQYRYLDWPGKVHGREDLAPAAIDEALDLAANPSPGDLDPYGGWLGGPQLAATGYFRVEKVAGKWWLVTPNGRLFFSNGITGVSDPDREGSTGVAVKTPITGREDYFATLPEPGDPAAAFLQYESATVTSGAYQGERPLTMNFFAANALHKYGPDWEAASQSVAHDRLRSWGVNTIGAWSDEDVFLQQRTAYTPVLFPANPSLINGAGTFPDYFDPAYRVNVETRLLEESGGSLNDPWNIGYFIHNELDWTRSTLTSDVDVGLAALAAAPSQPAKIALRDQLIASYGTVIELNAQWRTNYASWADFLSRRDVVPDIARAGGDLRQFDELYAETYFATNRAAMRAAAPNHLYLGARFTGSARLSAAQAAVRHADVVSINRYGVDVSILPAGLDADIPLISGEFHYSANDTGLWSDGLRTAANQQDRAARYTTYVTSALQDDRFVGVHWLQYWDFPSSGKLNSNNNNSNLGFVSVTDTPYAAMVEASRSLTSQMYETRLGEHAIVIDGALYVTGTASDDAISLRGESGVIVVLRNGVETVFDATAVSAIHVSGNLGDDVLNLSSLGNLAVYVRTESPGDAVFLQGDYDGSGAVDLADREQWEVDFGLAGSSADGNGDGRVDAADYTVWRDNLGAAWNPAPSAIASVAATQSPIARAVAAPTPRGERDTTAAAQAGAPVEASDLRFVAETARPQRAAASQPGRAEAGDRHGSRVRLPDASKIAGNPPVDRSIDTLARDVPGTDDLDDVESHVRWRTQGWRSIEAGLRKAFGR